MFFSVIIPIYNVEDYLEQCVNSVLNQTYKDLEIILVNDGSKDKCPEMCDDFAKKDERILVLHKKNGGLSSARNFGMDHASGKYILFLDSDDYWSEKEALNKLHEELLKVKCLSDGLLLTMVQQIKQDYWLNNGVGKRKDLKFGIFIKKMAVYIQDIMWRLLISIRN